MLRNKQELLLPRAGDEVPVPELVLRGTVEQGVGCSDSWVSVTAGPPTFRPPEPGSLLPQGLCFPFTWNTLSAPSHGP